MFIVSETGVTGIFTVEIDGCITQALGFDPLTMEITASTMVNPKALSLMATPAVDWG